jgi:predicted amidohydrolase YtcJ
VPKGVGDATVLDAAVADRPVVLEASDHHTMWVNSEALRRAGIDASTPDPALGRIIRHGDGTPVGTLVEWGAIAMVRELMPVPGPSEQEAGLARAMAALARSGITWVQEAASRPSEARVYAALARRGELTTRTNVAFRAEPGRWSGDRSRFGECRAELAADEAVRDHVQARTVKFFADGVIEMGTGFLVSPTRTPHTCGLPKFSRCRAAEAVTAFDEDGFRSITIGDGVCGWRSTRREAAAQWI